MEMDKLVLNKKINFKKAYFKSSRGFTLVEVLVATMIFLIFVTIALSALIISNDSAKRSVSAKTAIDNVQYSMELFTRTARLGTMYTCFNANALQVIVDTTTGSDCMLGQGVAFFVLDPTVTPNQTDMYAYYLENSGGDGRIMRCVERNIFSGGPPIVGPINMDLWNLGSDCVSLTAKEIDIDMFNVSVNGSSPSDIYQPSIRVQVGGTVTVKGDQVPLYVQTFISQRQYEQ
jgi:prepilin-type N-terminal cleavage/methylation domain-containing protein